MKEKSSQIQKQFGKSVKKYRLKQNISQEQLALKTGLDRTYISGIERGMRNPSLKNIEKIAKELKVSLSELFRF